jgi:integrase
VDALAGAGGAPSRADERRAACPGGGAGGDFLGSRRRAALRATNTRPRKFYATRHTFITQTLKAGAVSIKKVADYCGTSVEMIERHYADWMEPETAAELAGLGGTPMHNKRVAEAV